MNYVEIFRTSLTAFRSNIMRTALTMLGIIIGIASVILIIALGQGATASVSSSLSSLGANLITVSPGAAQGHGPVQGSSSVATLTYEDSQEIRNLPTIAATSAVVSSRYQVVGNDENTNVTVQGVSFEYPTVQSITVAIGEFITEDDEVASSKVAVLGPEVVTTLFGEGANPVGEMITIDRKSFRMIGVTTAKGSSGFSNPDETVYIPVTTMMNTLLGQDYVSSIQVVTDTPEQVDQASTDITNLLLGRHDMTEGEEQDFNIRTSQDTQSQFQTITTTLTAMLAGIAAISLVVGGIGIMNIMLVTVTERTKEIGLLKAIGAKRKDILTQFLIESIVLTLTGGLIGIIIGEALAFLISSIMNIPFIFQISSVLMAVGVSTFVGVVFGLYPAQRAAKLSPIDALRYE